MVLIIFTREGLDAFQSEQSEAVSAIWHNPDLLNEQDRKWFTEHTIECFALPKPIDAENTKATLWALEYVEKNSTDQEIMIECL